MNQVETELKQQAKHAGLRIKDIALLLKKPYPSVAGRLNGFSTMSQDERSMILKIIADKTNNKIN
jgi:hypothetical protein